MSAKSRKTSWIRLSSEFFLTPQYQYVISQPNGEHCIYFYFALCAALARCGTDGKLCDYVGGKAVPFAKSRIHTLMSHFPENEIEPAMNTLEAVGFLERGNDQILSVANFSTVIGTDAKEATV